MDRMLLGFLFFQAEDGIRDYKVTGVQTCAHPIFMPPQVKLANNNLPNFGDPKSPVIAGPPSNGIGSGAGIGSGSGGGIGSGVGGGVGPGTGRSEERRVGKEWRSRGGPYHYKKKKEINVVRVSTIYQNVNLTDACHSIEHCVVDELCIRPMHFAGYRFSAYVLMRNCEVGLTSHE